MMTAMEFKDAEIMDISTAADDDIVKAWHSYASKISFHHADDTGSEWGIAKSLMARARDIEKEIRNRGISRPEGHYLMTKGNRIDWETGEWSAGWDYRKIMGNA